MTLSQAAGQTALAARAGVEARLAAVTMPGTSLASSGPVNDSPAPEFDAPLQRPIVSAVCRPANALARAAGWGVVRTFVGLLAAGILLYHAATTG